MNRLSSKDIRKLRIQKSIKLTVIFIGLFLLHIKNENDTNKKDENPITNSNDKFEIIDNNLPQNENSNKPINYTLSKTLLGHSDRVSSLIKLESNLIATGSYDYTIKIWDISKDPSESLIKTKNSSSIIFCLLEFEPGKLLAGNSDNNICLYDLNNDEINEPIHIFYRHFLWISALVKCDETHFASSSNDAKIIIWDYKNKEYKYTLEGHTDCIMSMIMLNNGNLCTASADENIRIWDWMNMKCLFYFKPHEKYVKCLCQLNNGILLTGSDDKKIGIWNENYENIKLLDEHKHSVRTLCQINEKYFASGSFDKTIKIWDLDNKICVQTLEGHESNVINVIKYDENILISCSTIKALKYGKKIKK